MIDRTAYFQKQYLRYGGFCGTCGDGITPLVNDDIDTFGLCQHHGSHPSDAEDTPGDTEGKK